MEKYFVISDGDAPLRLFFSLEEAQKDVTNIYFIDSFDENGNKVNSWKWLEDNTWTEDF